ncbi:LCP family protein [Actinacidiphila acididurans]|uniref:LCP family protein n=1 Tax=Actinacidiphila acididurans TaxID=2784346 RepID=A0ABS2U8J2_9ACTN|nr:LCP family protein [Actinacidiphila acididurans]MBM9510488.1 LCP family protein [Actinacidiphila acididurans]
MRSVLRWVAICTGLLLVVAAGLGWATYRKFSGNIRTDRASARLLAQDARQRPPATAPGSRNILMLGGGGLGGADGAILLHLSAGRHRATAIGVPSDLMVRTPACPRPGGGRSPAAYERFGAAFRAGGAACSIRAFEHMTGIRVDHHLVVDAEGLHRLAAAVGGVNSADAARDRGGDLLRDLARGAGSGLRHPARLYGILNTATSSITADPGLSSLPALYELAGSLRGLPADGLVFRTVPATADRAGRDVPREPAAGRLFAAVRADRQPGAT